MKKLKMMMCLMTMTSFLFTSCENNSKNSTIKTNLTELQLRTKAKHLRKEAGDIDKYLFLDKNNKYKIREDVLNANNLVKLDRKADLVNEAINLEQQADSIKNHSKYKLISQTEINLKTGKKTVIYNEILIDKQNTFRILNRLYFVFNDGFAFYIIKKETKNKLFLSYTYQDEYEFILKFKK